MRNYLVLLRRELTAYYLSPIAYVVLCLFLILNGLSFYFTLVSLSRGPFTITVVQAFFNDLFFWIAYLLVFPVITMRTFSEEFKLGTIETLMTAPVRDEEVVAAKFSGAFLFYLTLWVPSLLYFLILGWYGNRNAVGFGAQLWGPYILLFVMGMFNTALGCFASVLTSNQIIAAMLASVLVLGTFFLTLMGYVLNSPSPWLRELFAYVAPVDHMDAFSRGIVDSRALVFYPSCALFILTLTYYVFQYRRWKI
jgi:ABC-2 type transport system permease protein